MANRVADFIINGVKFEIETFTGFGGIAQIQLTAQVNKIKKIVEIFNINKVGDKTHISPVNKKVSRLPLPKDIAQSEIDFDEDIIAPSVAVRIKK